MAQYESSAAAGGGGAAAGPGGGLRGHGLRSSGAAAAAGVHAASGLFSAFRPLPASAVSAEHFPSSTFSVASLLPRAAAAARWRQQRQRDAARRDTCGVSLLSLGRESSSRSRSSSRRAGRQQQLLQQHGGGGEEEEEEETREDGGDGCSSAFAFEKLLQQQQQEYGRLLRHCGAAAAEEGSNNSTAAGGLAAAAAALLLKQQLSAGAGSVGPAAQPPPATAARQRGRHTIVCRHWLKGMCMKGDFCDFLHQLIYLRMPACRNQLWCPDIRRGCCPFKHADVVVQSSGSSGAAAAAEGGETRSKSVGRGSSSVEQQLLQPQQKECLAYFLGFCKAGPKCRRRHTPRHRSELPLALPAWYLSLVVANASAVFPAEVDAETEEELALVAARCREICETSSSSSGVGCRGTAAAAVVGVSNRSAFCSSLPRAAAAAEGSFERRSSSHRRLCEAAVAAGSRSGFGRRSVGRRSSSGGGGRQQQQQFAGGGDETATEQEIEERAGVGVASVQTSWQQQQQSFGEGQQQDEEQTASEQQQQQCQRVGSVRSASSYRQQASERPVACRLSAAAAAAAGYSGKKGSSSSSSSRGSATAAAGEIEEEEVVSTCVVPLLVDALNIPATPHSRKRFFIIKCNKMNNICTSVQHGVWATSRLNSKRLTLAFNDAEHVLLLFSANESGGFQGFARMMSPPDPTLFPNMLWGAVQLRLGCNFRLRWLKQCRAEFEELGRITNPWNDNLPLKKSRDGTELPPALGALLCTRLAQQPSEDLLAATGVDPTACIDHSTFFTLLAQTGMLPMSPAAAAAAGGEELPQPTKPIELASDSQRYAQQQQHRHQLQQQR